MNPEKFMQSKEREADEINSKRPFADKILGKNKVTGMDLVMDEAEKDNALFDAEKALREERAERIAQAHRASADAKSAEKRDIPEVKFRCKFCGQEFAGRHLCSGLEQKGYTIPISPSDDRDTSSFFNSFVVGEMTGNPILGSLAGGSMSGALMGASTHHGTETVEGGGGTSGGGGAAGAWVDSAVDNHAINGNGQTETNETNLHEFQAPENKY